MLSKHRIVVVTPTLMLLITLDTLSTRKWKKKSQSVLSGRRVGKTRLGLAAELRKSLFTVW